MKKTKESYLRGIRLLCCSLVAFLFLDSQQLLADNSVPTKFLSSPEGANAGTCECANPDDKMEGEFCMDGGKPSFCCRCNSCGDGIVNPVKEECDEGTENGKPGVRCTKECKLRKCGDRTIDTDLGEECDDGPEGSESCTRSCRPITDDSCGRKLEDPAYGRENCCEGVIDPKDYGHEEVVSYCEPTWNFDTRIFDKITRRQPLNGSEVAQAERLSNETAKLKCTNACIYGRDQNGKTCAYYPDPEFPGKVNKVVRKCFLGHYQFDRINASSIYAKVVDKNGNVDLDAWRMFVGSGDKGIQWGSVSNSTRATQSADPSVTRVNYITDEFGNICLTCALVRSESGCFAPGTKIRLADGTDKVIEDIAAGDEVLNPVTGKAVKVKSLVESPEAQPVIEIEFAGGKIRVSQTHPMLTDQGIVPAFAVQAGMQLKSDGELRAVQSAQELPLAFNQRVLNITLDADEDFDNHMLLADGVITGDLFVQQHADNVQ